MRDKIGYTLGDLGNCCTEQFRGMFLAVFYTLILRVNPVHIGILMLVTKLWDAFNDPIIGAIIDLRIPSKNGKFVPWIRVFAFPMGVLCVLGFVNVSDLDYGFRIAYMFISYVLYEAMYTCVNVPFGSLSSVMTDDINQRTALSRYRALGGTIFMTVIVIVGPLVLYVNNQPVAGRFLMLASVCAMIGVLCLLLSSAWCKERVSLPQREEKIKLNYLHVLKEISRNRALLGMMFASLVVIIGASVTNGLNTYMFRDYFGNVKLMAVSGMLSTVFALIAFFGTQPVAKRLGKKEWSVYGCTFSALVFAALFLFPIKNPMLFIAVNGMCYLGASGLQILVWAMVNDAIDYHELRTGKRNEGIVYSTYTFFRKLAGAVSGSLSSFVLAMIGYNVAAKVQDVSVTQSLWKAYTGVYVLGYGLAVAILLLVYPLTKQKTQQMHDELAKKRAAKLESIA
ncbi:MAG: glycoside-pentoside-hexuronide (GPH):cation symporter [Spirochaetes bacterium]|nr:glycoside-pentoside-hexuronide (GPH):cation symporter [Spirochaetota bacterium]MBU1078985.1 glycoside-pentoside-hexuronide (GPH):cation symporter [Spirochaetota bacterium]